MIGWNFRGGLSHTTLPELSERSRLVPTVPVGMPSRTLCVLFRWPGGAASRRRGASQTAFPRESAMHDPQVRSRRHPCFLVPTGTVRTS